MPWDSYDISSATNGVGVAPKQHTTVPGGYGNIPLHLKVIEAVYRPSLINVSKTEIVENVPIDFPPRT
jgi:hypothetical protein